MAPVRNIRIALDKASFDESFVKVGIVPCGGGAWLARALQSQKVFPNIYLYRQQDGAIPDAFWG
ncbi:hypothetical protein B9Z40_07595 [Limnohabitans sp. 15K]|jgi:enoyl-CoA hydratase/carnithine racemase|nr:hypothetical protein [Limnohabitans sp. 15K]PIT83492.1 hypothetical protein B9Z40_07595 [Limnohabitans sp. 15K]